jgi:titin
MRTIAHRLAALGATAVVVAGTALAATPAHAAGAAPVAVDDFYTAAPGELLVLDPSISPFANDYDPEGDALDFFHTDVNAGAFPGGSIVTMYTPQTPVTIQISADASGTVGFQYRVTDGTTPSAWGKVSIEVVPVGDPEPQPEPETPSNTPPVGVDDWYYVVPGENYSLPGSTVLANASDADGDAITAQWATSLPGDSTQAVDGSFSWSVPADFCGEFPVQYRPFDGIEAGNLTTITLRASVDASGIYAPCAAPVETLVANDDLFFAEPGQSITVPATWGLLSNDVHSGGTGFGVVSYSEPSAGAFALLADGSFTWTAPADFCDTLTFTYTAGDGAATSNVATVTLYASISGGDVECEEPGDEPGGEPGDEPIDQPGSPTIPTLPLPTDPGTPVDEPGQPEYAATPGRDGLAHTGADDLAQGIGWGALLAIVLGLGFLAPRLRRGRAA